MKELTELDKQLLIAAKEGKTDKVESLWRKGADLDAQDPQNGMTAMHIACQHEDASMVKFLYGLGALTTIEDNYGRTPKKVASFMGRAYRALAVAEAFEMDRSMLDM